MDGIELKYVLKFLWVEEMWSLGNDNFEGEGDFKIEEEEVVFEDRCLCIFLVDFKKWKRKFFGDKVFKVIL